jgi:deoxyribonuclease V
VQGASPTIVPKGNDSGWFDIGGRRLFLRCTGHGSPTVVFEGGLTSDWYELQNQLSGFMRVCSYDRPGGLGSSSDPAPTPGLSAICGASDTSGMATWPATAHELTQLQQVLGEMTPEHWRPPANVLRIGACFACFERVLGAGAAGDQGFVGAAVTYRRRLLAGVSSVGPAGGPYRPTLLALREGPLLEDAVRALPITPEVLIVNATGRDHPRRAGLALHLGAVLGLPTVGVTTRPLLAQGAWPVDQRAATARLLLDNEVVGYWVRTRPGAKPVAVHAAWQTDAQAAVQVVLAATRRARTPEPLRRARTLARTKRARSR